MSQLNEILKDYTSEKVTLRKDDKSEALDFCWPVVEEILKYVKIKDTRFAGMEIQRKGSYYERCKVGEPDEFDLMLVIKDLELDGVYEFIHDGMSKPPTGFTRVMMANSREMLSASRVKSVFANLVRRAIRELKCEGFVEASSHGPAVKLLITNYSDGKSYSIDLVPAIKDKTWPEDANEWISRERDWPKEELVDEIWQDGCHLVAKFPRGITVPEHEKEFLWRYSFSGAEKKLFLKGGQGEAGSCSKQVLRILKALKDELQLHPLTSYHLKTIFFYECEQNPHHNWSFNCLGERFMDLLQRLQDCLSIRSCPHYFISKLNLFETFSEQRCRELNGKIQRIQIDPCRALSHLMK